MLYAAFALLLIPSPQQASAPSLSEHDRTAAFTTAGLRRQGGTWRSDCGDPGTASYSGGDIETVRDLNGDGRPDAVLVEGSVYCYGMTGQGYWLVSKQADGKWRLLASGTGILRFLATKGTGGWPDMEIGGPGFCFPVHRFDGQAYRQHRLEYEGKACQRN